MLIPYKQLSEDALNGLIKDYLVREHGLNCQIDPVSDNKDIVLRALAKGILVVVYSKINNSAWLASNSAA